MCCRRCRPNARSVSSGPRAPAASFANARSRSGRASRSFATTVVSSGQMLSSGRKADSSARSVGTAPASTSLSVYSLPLTMLKSRLRHDTTSAPPTRRRRAASAKKAASSSRYSRTPIAVTASADAVASPFPRMSATLKLTRSRTSAGSVERRASASAIMPSAASTPVASNPSRAACKQRSPPPQPRSRSRPRASPRRSSTAFIARRSRCAPTGYASGSSSSP